MGYRVIAGDGAIAIPDFGIIVTATGTLTLPVAPLDGWLLWIKRNYVGLNYTINGNGINIDGFPTTVLNANYQAIWLVYIGDLNEWHIG